MAIAATAVSGTLLLVALAAIITLITCYRGSTPTRPENSNERARSPTGRRNIHSASTDDSGLLESEDESLLNLSSTSAVQPPSEASSTFPSLTTRPVNNKSSDPITVPSSLGSPAVDALDGKQNSPAMITVAGALSNDDMSPHNSLLAHSERPVSFVGALLKHLHFLIKKEYPVSNTFKLNFCEALQD